MYAACGSRAAAAADRCCDAHAAPGARRPVERITLRGTLMLPGYRRPWGWLQLRVLRPGKRPHTVPALAADGAFKVRLDRYDGADWTIEVWYPGSIAYEPLVTSIVVP